MKLLRVETLRPVFNPADSTEYGRTDHFSAPKYILTLNDGFVRIASLGGAVVLVPLTAVTAIIPAPVEPPTEPETPVAKKRGSK